MALTKLARQIYDMAKRIGYGFPNLISSSAYVSPYAELGWGCVVLNNAVVQNGSAVGNRDQCDNAWAVTEQYEMRFQDMIRDDEKPIDK